MQAVVISFYCAALTLVRCSIARGYLLARVLFSSAFCFYWVSVFFSSYCWLAFPCPGMDIKLILRLVCEAFFAWTDESKSPCLVFSALFCWGDFRRVHPTTCGTNSTLFISQLEVTLLVFRACVRAIFVGTFSWFLVFALSTFVFPLM